MRRRNGIIRKGENRILPPTIVSALIGMVTGTLVTLYLALGIFSYAPSKFHYTLILILAFLGGISSLAFFFLARRIIRKASISICLSAVCAVFVTVLYTEILSVSDVNVLLIVSDATRADHLSCYGYDEDTTPNLDSLAACGVLFRNAIAQGSHTVVATPSIIASIYPSQHGMTTYRDVLSDSVVTLAEVLKQNDFETVGISTNPHLTEVTNFSQGFSIYKSDRSWLNTDAEKVVDNFLSWLDTNERKRFFAFLFLVDPHSPYEPPERFLRKFGGDERFVVHDWNLDSLRLYEGEQRRELIARYDGELGYLDYHLGRLFRELKRQRRYDRTMIIFTSDHGEAFWDHGGVGHGDTLYEELLKIPLIMKLPKIFTFPELVAAGRIIGDPVAQLDVMPTVLEFLNLESPQSVQGVSLLPVIFGKRDLKNRKIFSEEILLQLGPYNIRSLRENDWKFILNQKFPEGIMQRELFNLANDPRETVNVIEEHSDVARRLERELIVFMGRMERMNLASGKSSVPTRSMLESLKELGYIQ
ncbi:MAG: sulfatase [Candidatus Glassbacteria bacterium]